MPAQADSTRAIYLRLEERALRMMRERFGESQCRLYARYLARLVYEDFAREEGRQAAMQDRNQARAELYKVYGLTPKEDVDEMLVT